MGDAGGRRATASCSTTLRTHAPRTSRLPTMHIRRPVVSDGEREGGQTVGSRSTESKAITKMKEMADVLRATMPDYSDPSFFAAPRKGQLGGGDHVATTLTFELPSELDTQLTSSDSVASLSTKVREMRTQLVELSRIHHATVVENERLREDIRMRQEAYDNRQAETECRLTAMTEELKKFKQDGQDIQSDVLDELRLTHSRIQSGMSALNAAKTDDARKWVEDDDDSESHSSSGSGGVSPYPTGRQQHNLDHEVRFVQQEAMKLEEKNKRLASMNARLRLRAQSHKEEQELLTKQMTKIKKENARQREEIEALRRQVDRFEEEARERVSHQTNLDVHEDVSGVMERKYYEAIRHLKNVLDLERKNFRQLRASYVAEVSLRTEALELLEQCIKDVRAESADLSAATTMYTTTTARSARPRTRSGTPHCPPSMDPYVNEFTRGQRERVLDLLLSKERVLTLLYAKCSSQHSLRTPMEAWEEGYKEDDLDGILLGDQDRSQSRGRDAPTDATTTTMT